MSVTFLRALLSVLLVAAPALAAGAKVYPDPTAATDALVAAARSGEVKSVLAVLGAMLLVVSVSIASSRPDDGSVPGTAWMKLMLARVCDTPVVDQNCVRSLVFGNVSMTIAVVEP